MKILVLTTEYPFPETKIETPVVHFFTKEWIKMGHKVIVIRNKTIFPHVFYWIATVFKKTVVKLIGNYVETKRDDGDISFILDGVLVNNMPIFKYIPHGKFPKNSITKQLQKIARVINLNDFQPDVIIGHFYNPQIELVSKLKVIYPQARSCIVLHENPSIIKEKYTKNHLELVKSIDVWGFRFQKLQDDFEFIYGNNFKSFICHSGVPAEYLRNSYRVYKQRPSKFCFVGQLIPLKRVSDIILALSLSFPNKDFIFNIVGEGFEHANLKKMVEIMGLIDNVKFLGKQNRNFVQQVLNESDCFVMVSESEAFGLVYLEAMSKGCLTIGTRGQGIDGVIVNNINGFLCESKNPEELSSIFNKIIQMPFNELNKISKQAIDTAREMTDEKVARKYLDTVLKT
jgi:glycosyltransferase involved in cell wall biosynthesis